MYGFLALDLDGTLLNRDKKIAKRTLAALDEYAQSNPDSVNAVITGRYEYSARKYVNFVNGQCAVFRITYLGTGNGALFYGVDPETKALTLIDQLLVSRDDASEIFDICKRRKLMFWGYPQNLHRGAPIVLSAVPGAYATHFFRFIDTHVVRSFVNDDYSKINVVAGSRKKLNAVLNELKRSHAGKFQISETSRYMLEVTAAGAHKGRIVEAICAKHAIPVSARIAVGDSSNDREMFARVGTRLAPINVRDQLRTLADYVGTKRGAKRFSCLFDDYLFKQTSQRN